MKPLHVIALILVIVGALNWGLIGFFGFDLVAFLFGGPEELLSRIVYGLVGIAGVVVIFTAAAYARHGAYSTHHRAVPAERPPEHRKTA